MRPSSPYTTDFNSWEALATTAPDSGAVLLLTTKLEFPRRRRVPATAASRDTGQGAPAIKIPRSHYLYAREPPFADLQEIGSTRLHHGFSVADALAVDPHGALVDHSKRFGRARSQTRLF